MGVSHTCSVVWASDRQLKRVSGLDWGFTNAFGITHICMFTSIYNSIFIYKMVVFIIIPWSLVAPSRTLQQWEGNASIKIAPYCHVSHLLPTPSYTVACFQTNVKQYPDLVSVNGVSISYSQDWTQREKKFIQREKTFLNLSNFVQAISDCDKRDYAGLLHFLTWKF